MTSIAKLVSETDLGNGFMKAEYEGDWSLDWSRSTEDADGKRTVSSAFEGEGPHVIKWEWGVTYDVRFDGYDNINTTLTAAEYSPVSFHFTWTLRDGTTAGQEDFQLSGPGESRAERFGVGCWYASSVKYKISFRYPIDELPLAVASPAVASPSSALMGLSNDCGKMMQGCYSDVSVTAGTKVFHLHKSMLASRSEVFDRMLKADMVESRSNKIDLDMDENIAEEMFRFIYTGKVQGLEQIAAELLHVAVMYELAALKHMCLQELVKKVDEESAAETLVIADRYSNVEEDYKNSILMYISRNYFTVVLTDGWRELTVTNPELNLAATTFHVQQNS